MEFYEVISFFGIILAVCFGIMVISALLACLGFTPAGVVAQSCASAWQSSIGNVVKGSLFAIMQSFAALGYLANAAVLPTIVAAATIGALTYFLFYYDGDKLPSIENTSTISCSNITTFSHNATQNIGHDAVVIWSNVTKVAKNIEDNIEP